MTHGSAEKQPRPVPWLADGQAFPPLESAWGLADPAPGLLAAGETLDLPTLIQAYSQGIFPWYSLDQPVLWWSPDPRMVLQTRHFKLHRSLRKSLRRFQLDASCEIRFDNAFERVISACSEKPRAGQSGTWIVPDMVQAYRALHEAGHAHSVETWINGELAGGLYCVNLGRMVFGESMFAHQTDASKIALAALVAFCRASGIAMIDCQQNTPHLASLGAAEISRSEFAAHLGRQVYQAAPKWQFQPLYWNQILSTDMPTPS
ncbi:leucyl/phenylalanyl-tRNA--protein transferase [Polaromonas sp. OV174]|uniref:leucyl/phenylalanyl-tRNA--protein transferase n=1 Tax=Polaromonas sp. OV174 TaxID=1855300 RepID=UPI0008E83FED|nr:leucyl/phenylalanyl-tRNA--protein transferase [Polaromonas sp. OV174]SFC37396.1 leucyl/phenylalanyl-tRNA--protein transferase [Polaromonas sp. OV174]